MGRGNANFFVGGSLPLGKACSLCRPPLRAFATPQRPGFFMYKVVKIFDDLLFSLSLRGFVEPVAISTPLFLFIAKSQAGIPFFVIASEAKQSPSYVFIYIIADIAPYRMVRSDRNF